MSNKIKTFTQFLKVKDDVLKSVSPLSRLGIHVKLDNWPEVKFNWQQSESIARQVSELSIFEALTLEEKLTLALAVQQELQNDYIGRDQMKIVNDFFETKITFDMVQKFNSQYV